MRDNFATLFQHNRTNFITQYTVGTLLNLQSALCYNHIKGQ